MARPDGVYALTRRRGSTGVVKRLTGTSANPQTGVRTDTYTDTTVRFMQKGATQFSRLFRAQQTQQRIGDTTFVIWLPDVEAIFTELTTEDQITYGGKTYEVLTSDVEDTALVITAREYQ